MLNTAYLREQRRKAQRLEQRKEWIFEVLTIGTLTLLFIIVATLK